jgi:mitochondrial import inner membrane translocase subunit TIM44
LYRAGAAVVLHKDAEKREKWDTLKETNPVLRGIFSLRRAYEETENPVITSIRGVTDSVSSFLFDETEQAQVTRLLKNMDPNWNMEAFQRELREYIIPEVVDAYLSADKESLKLWCGEGVGNGYLSAPQSDCLADFQRPVGYTGYVPPPRTDQ